MPPKRPNGLPSSSRVGESSTQRRRVSGEAGKNEQSRTKATFAPGADSSSLANMFNAAYAQMSQSHSQPPLKRRRIENQSNHPQPSSSSSQTASISSTSQGSPKKLGAPSLSDIRRRGVHSGRVPSQPPPPPPPPPPSGVKQERSESPIMVGASPQSSAVAIKEEPADPGLLLTPQVVCSGLTTHGSYRVKSLPHPGENRMAWVQEQFKILKNLAQVDIKISRRPIFLPDGLVIDWTSEVPVVLDENFIPRTPPPSSDLRITPAGRQTPLCESSRQDNFVTPPTPQSLPPLPAINRMLSSSSPTPLSLFAIHRQRYASSQQSTTSSMPPPHSQPTRSSSVAESESESSASIVARTPVEDDLDEKETVAKLVQPDTNSDDDLYMAWEEYERLSKSVEPKPPVQSYAPPDETDDTIPATLDSAWDLTQCERLEYQAAQWLKDFIRVFDSDRSLLASAYSQGATFSVRELSHMTSQPAPPSGHPPLRTGTLDIVTSLLDLPDTFAFNLVDANSRVEYDLVVTFDVVVYGSKGEQTPFIMLVCYADPAHCPVSSGDDDWRWVCEMRFVLRSKTWDERDRSLEGLWSLVALSHQMTLRKIPANMSWRWNNHEMC